MAIEFRCTGCQKLLRTPDESAGKKAKCPQCGAFVDIPVAPGPATPGFDPLGPAPSLPFGADPFATPVSPNANPFAETKDVRGPGSAANQNPYAAPGVTASGFSVAQVAKTAPVHTIVVMDDLLNHPWTILTNNLGPLVVLGLIPFGVSMALQVVSTLANLAAQATKETAIMIVVQISFGILGFLVQTWLHAGTIVYMSNFLRSGRPNLQDIFQGTRYFLGVIVANLIFLFLLLGLLAVAGLPALGVLLVQGADNVLKQPIPMIVVGSLGALLLICAWIWISIRYILVYFFMIDREQGVLQAIGSSARFMQGNIGAAFLAGLVVSVVSIVFFCCTCGFGQLVLVPFWSLFIGVLYMTATGQATFDRPAPVVSGK